MLGFTHQSKGTGNRWIDKQPSFQPIIITNKLPKEVSPKKQQKTIGKVTQLKKGNRPLSRQTGKQSKAKQQKVAKSEWNTGGAVRGAFDKNLRNNDLAAEQRRLRAQLKKEKELNHQQIIINEKKIGTKALNMMKQKDEEIEHLKKMIEREKQEKAKIDRLYELKKQQIQRERLELMQLERKIQKEGIKEKKVIKEIQRLNSPQRQNQIRSISRQNLTEQVPSREIVRQQIKRTYDEPTQSEALHQKNILRQKQLDYLINQREKAVKAIPNINYSPTLIPLLSKASYKIVSTHVSQIVELLVDQLLEEQVYLLEQIQLEEAKEKQERKAKEMLNEYCEMVCTFVDQNDQIASKVGKYSTMNFADVYKPKHYPESERKSAFSYDNPQSVILRRICLEDEFDDDRSEEIQNRKDRFVRFVSNFDEYKKPNMDMFSKCTEQIIDEAIQKLARELDKGSGEFVDIVFRNQFN